MEWNGMEWELRGEMESEREYGEYRIDESLVWIDCMKIIQAISVGEVELLRDFALFIQYRHQSVSNLSTYALPLSTNTAQHGISP